MTEIAVIGMGYVGIPCAVLLADVDGYHVTGVQRQSKRSGWKIDVLNQGKNPFEGDEPGLDELISKVVKKGTFKVTDDFNILANMDIILVDVQTPTDDDHVPQYLSLKEVSTTIGKVMKRDCMVVIESTVAPGTTEHLVKPILERESGMKAGTDFSLAFSYERVMPGKLLEYIVDMPRVIGGVDERSRTRAYDMYKNIVNKPLHVTDCMTAELSKTIENAYRDVNIAFANEMALVAESLGVNIYDIREFINERHDRHMHIPGAGVGGHCLPKDSWLLRHGLMEYGRKKVEPDFISLARKINEYMPVHITSLALDALKDSGVEAPKSKVTILGVAYLENSDDIRNTPAYAVINALQLQGAEIICHDPHVRDFDAGVPVTRDLGEALTGSDAAIIVTKHREYCDMDLSKMKEQMRTPILIDGRNVYSREAVEGAGFVYKSVGKGN